MQQFSSKILECTSSETISLVSSISEETLLILDFDETLFLRNSTEEYLNTLKPRLLGIFLLILLNKLKPWSWFPKKHNPEKTRDWIRVVVSTLIFPWTPVLWKRKAKELARLYSNSELIQSTKNNSNLKPIIASQGFTFIIEPIVQDIPISVEHLVACRFWRGINDRQLNKEELITKRSNLSQFSESILITDSLDDASLLSLVKYPCFTKWPNSACISAMSDMYLPILYYERVKRPGEKPFVNTIIKNHLVTLGLALSWTSPNPVLHLISMFFLVLSFWCIYEIGYYENDRIAEQYESEPVLSKTYQNHKLRIGRWQPWVWATMFSAVGMALLETTKFSDWSLGGSQLLGINNHFNTHQLTLNFCIWAGVLLLTRLTFWAYNYLDKQTRVWLYPVLQLYKYFGFAAISMTNLMGSILLFTQVLAEWIPYLIYRFAKKRYDSFQQSVFRLVAFLCLSVAMATASQDILLFTKIQFWGMLIWCFLRGREQIGRVISEAYPIWKNMTNLNR